MSARSYLSIGDVLTLLRQEFPDVTISKIRFLESQGLVNPERTPSGYRKFYEHDVERLRWVLRQQREHFLPLKVIKDRLEDGSAESDAESAAVAAAEVDAETGSVPVPAHATAVDADLHSSVPDQVRVGDPVLVGQRVGAGAGGHSAAAGAHPAGEAPRSMVVDAPLLPGSSATGDGSAEGSAPTSDRTANGPSPSTSQTPARPAPTTHGRGADRTPLLELVDDSAASGPRVPPADPASHAGGGSSAGDGASAVPAAVPAAGPAPSGPSATGSAAARRNKTATTARTASGEPGRAAKGGAKPSAATASSSPPASAAPAVPKALSGSGVSLSAEELAAASGLDLEILSELKEYGLLVATTVAGVEHFNEEALTVATAAAGFTRYGIEPRHLRLYKNAAEREAGFVEQVVLPLVRQRNPEARARAHETAEELTQLGLQLRGALLRSALGNLLNG